MIKLGTIVVLTLTVWDTETGTKLEETQKQVAPFAITGDKMETCRVAGVAEAYKLTEKYKAKYPHASTNVNCRWEYPKEQL